MVSAPVTSLRNDESGAVAMITAVALPLLILAGGVGVELGRIGASNVKAGNALDAAMLTAATAEGADNAQRENIARRIFELNHPDNFMGSDITSDDLDITLVGQDPPVSVRGNVGGTINNILLPVNNVADTYDVVAANEVVAGGMPAVFDVVLVADVSGSMGCPIAGCNSSHGTEKITLLQNSANQLVEDLRDINDEAPGNSVRMALVPYDGDAPTDNGSQALDMTDITDDDVTDAIDSWEQDGGATAGGPAAAAGRDRLFDAPDPQQEQVWVFLSDGLFNVDNDPDTGLLSPLSRVNSEAQFLDVCDELLDQNVLVYTISLGDVADGGLLESCVSEPDTFFFDPETADELDDAFEQIGATLETVRIVD